MRAAVIFDNFGPYHLARLAAAARHCDLRAIEVYRASREYAWCRPAESTELAEETLFELDMSGIVQASALQERLDVALSRHDPQVVFIPGWSSRAAMFALQWCLRNGVPSVVMSESQEADSRRRWISERFKRRIVGLFSAALVGGRPHAEYMVSLGMPAGQVSQGYDVVDNEFFATKVDALRTAGRCGPSSLGDGPGYFLAISRFVEKKNLPFLIRAFAAYRQQMQELQGARPLDLALVGDGPMRGGLEGLRSDLRLDDALLMPGFVQYDELPAYLAGARALIHASTAEQWGLVVNEGMASGLPVVVSTACGCASDLVVDGVTGFQFGPTDRDELIRRMVELTVDPLRGEGLGLAARAHVRDWGVDRFGIALVEAGRRAIGAGPKRARRFDSLLLAAVARR